MSTIERYRVAWSGFTGSPGVSTFYYFGSVDPAGSLHAMFDAIKGRFPSTVTWSFPATGDTIDDTTGDLNGSFSSAGAASVTGTDAGVYSAASGVVIRWLTGTIVGGHRVRGHTFLVPLAGSAYQGDGSISTTPLGDIQTAVNTYLATTAGLAQVIWRRPGAPGGAGHVAVTGAIVPDLAAVLRSRRS